MIRGATEYAGYAVEVVCIDPYPSFLQKAGQLGMVELVAEPAQSVALNVLVDVGEDGLLFVDSTHTVKPNSEVNRIVLEVLPRLAPGNFVHFHDVLFPYDYPRDVLADALFFWSESSLLHAFLIANALHARTLDIDASYEQPGTSGPSPELSAPSQQLRSLRRRRRRPRPVSTYLRVKG